MSGFSLLQSPPPAKNLLIPPPKKSHPSRLPHTRFLFPQQMVNSAPTKQQLSGYSPIKTSFQLQSLLFLFCIMFTIASYSLYTETTLILILVDVQYLEDVGFSSKSLLLKFSPANKKFPPGNLLFPPILLPLFENPKRQ